MFERYSISASARQIGEHFNIDVPDRYRAFYNAGPTQLLPVITHDSPAGLSFFYWGAIPEWIKNKNISEKLVNIRGESIPEKSAFVKKLMKYRCLVPLDGFYCWKKVGKKTSIPYRFFLKDKKLMAMAALWEEFEDENEETHHTFSVITIPSSSQVSTVSERMPLILDAEGQKIWMNAEAEERSLLNLLSRNQVPTFEFFTVSPRIASLKANDASLILPSAPADQFGNLTLFD